jgi:hypothetical protein
MNNQNLINLLKAEEEGKTIQYLTISGYVDLIGPIIESTGLIPDMRVKPELIEQWAAVYKNGSMSCFNSKKGAETYAEENNNVIRVAHLKEVTE